MREAKTGLHVFDQEQGRTEDLGGDFTPGQFFREAGRIVLVCLALGLLLQLLAWAAGWF